MGGEWLDGRGGGEWRGFGRCRGFWDWRNGWGDGGGRRDGWRRFGGWFGLGAGGGTSGGRRGSKRRGWTWSGGGRRFLRLSRRESRCWSNRGLALRDRCWCKGKRCVFGLLIHWDEGYDAAPFLRLSLLLTTPSAKYTIKFKSLTQIIIQFHAIHTLPLALQF